MKLLTLLSALSLSSIATASWDFTNQQVMGTKTPSPKVPGENPFEFCETPGDDWILNMTRLDISPNPPQPGDHLTVNAWGEFKDTVYPGSYVSITVKYGLITIIRRKEDLCEQANVVSQECPINGTQTVKASADLPSQIPPGTFTVTIDAYNNDTKKITCVAGKVTF